MSQKPAQEGHAPDNDATRAPAGYTADQVALCKRLTAQTIAEMRQHPGHVVLSCLLTSYMQIASEYGGDAQIRAAEYLVMTGSGFLNQVANVASGADIDDAAVIASALTGFLAPRRHGPSIDALLMVFKALAQKFPCCTQTAAEGARRVGDELAIAASLSSPPTSMHVH